MVRLEPKAYRTPTLEKYATDLTKMAEEGKLDPMIGRQEQLARVTQILCRCRKNNPCLVGEPGVGKTVIAEGLALHIANARVPVKLQKMKVFSVDMARLVAGTTYRGDFEERLMMIVDEIKESKGEIVLFIDELHTLIGAGRGSGSLDGANILKPALARGELKCIGATTLKEYKNYIEKDAALERRFQPVKVPEPSIEEAIQILRGLCKHYELHHTVKYSEEALVSAVKLSHRYIRGGYSACCIIQHVVSLLTGIPVEKVSRKDSKYLLRLEETLCKTVIGQTEAVNVTARAIRRSRAGIRDPRRPIGCFLFTGPTGVGKTELANVLANEYFGSKEAMIRLDMSEFYERHTVSKLVDAPPGYIGYDEGGQLTEPVRSCPHTLILLDEVEKAHRDVFNIMLQIFDAGRLTDNKGRIVDFSNTIIIMTSNIGSTVTGKGNARVAEELRKCFREEFLNRLDEVIVFHQLSKSEVMQIASLMLKEVSERLLDKKIKLQTTEAFNNKIAEEGYSPTYGARPLKRTIMRLLEDRLATKILDGEINEGESIIADVDAAGDVFTAVVV